MSTADDGAQRFEARSALARARDELAGGSVERAWQACLSAVRWGRELNDADLVADAATLIEGPQVGLHHLTDARRALCLEALAMLDPDQSAHRQRLQHHLTALSGGWTAPPTTTFVRWTDEDARAVILELRAAHAATMAPDRLVEQLSIATRLRDVARAVHRDQDTAWGILWRMDALAQLGRRIEMNADFVELLGLTRRLDVPHWNWRVATIRAALALLDDHLSDVEPLADAAARLGGHAGVEEAPFVDLVLRSYLALRTGEGLPRIEGDVRRALDEAPFMAQSWRAGILVAIGQVDDAVEIWRALAPHIDHVPRTAMEWLVVTTAHAQLSIVADDQPAAAHLFDLLSPYALLHVMPTVMTPYGGPVALYLGDLATFLRRWAEARTQYGVALTGSQDMHAPAYSKRAREALARLNKNQPRSLAPLSPRESEVAELIGAGRTNREVAQQLFLSERTVENHVSNILHRLGLPNRTAVAA